MTTVDDLMLIFDEAEAVVSVTPTKGGIVPMAAIRRAGIRAVVEALRDEIVPERMRITSANDTCTRSSLRQYFNEILGSDAGAEKVAGGSTREDERSVEQLGATSSHATTSPATDPLPHLSEREKALFVAALKGDAGPTTPPATAAAPAVCEWTMDTHPDDGSHYDTACGDAWCSVLGGTPKQDNYSFCPSCGKPITFTEEKT